jgi:PPP family 3-phenylpropionic acid transporter
LDHDPTIDHPTPPQGHPASHHAWNRAGIRIGGGYFWYFAAVGTFSPFAALYYRDLGFSGLQVGILTAIPSLWAAFLGPVLGALSDSLAIHRLMLRAALVLAAVLALVTSQATAFIPILILVGLLTLATVPVPALLDSYALTTVERRGVSYGRLRVWGSLGYMALTLVVGRIMGDRVSSVLLVAYAACLGLTFLTVFPLPRLADRHPRPLLDGLQEIRRNRPLLLLITVAYLLSSGSAIMNVFLAIHVQELGGSASLIGVAFALSAASELPIVAFGGWILARLGTVTTIALALVVYTVRMIAFSLITVPEWILPVQMLHGLSFGAFLMASVTLAYRLAGRHQAATAQALLTAMSFGFGSITGSLVGGALLDSIGTVGLFRGAAVLMLVTLAILVIGNRRIGLDRSA